MSSSNEKAIFILSHGRAKNVKTWRLLEKKQSNLKRFIVVDDTDEQLEEYQKRFGLSNVIIFSKEVSKKQNSFDMMDNFKQTNSVVYARNKVWEIAKEIGCRKFLVLDDDYASFNFRFNAKGIFMFQPIGRRFDAICNYFWEFLENTETLTISFSQGGDFIGGKNSAKAQQPGLLRKAMNSFFCLTERPFEFNGRINEDVNAYLSLGATGKLFFQSTHVDLNQALTQTNSGGLTDIYLDLGTYVKSFYSVMCAPSCVKVQAMEGALNPRIHHRISWNNAVPKIIREQWKKS